jgi:hypothetical protein
MFEDHVRVTFTKLGKPCVLDGTSQKLLQWFQCGRWALVERDLHAVLPAGMVSSVLEICDQHHVRDAFACRRELINYKKALLTQVGPFAV